METLITLLSDTTYSLYVFIAAVLLIALVAFIASLGISDDGQGVITEMDRAIQKAPRQFSGAESKRRSNVVSIERQRRRA